MACTVTVRIGDEDYVLQNIDLDEFAGKTMGQEEFLASLLTLPLKQVEYIKNSLSKKASDYQKALESEDSARFPVEWDTPTVDTNLLQNEGLMPNVKNSEIEALLNEVGSTHDPEYKKFILSILKDLKVSIVNKPINSGSFNSRANGVMIPSNRNIFIHVPSGNIKELVSKKNLEILVHEAVHLSIHDNIRNKSDFSESLIPDVVKGFNAILKTIRVPSHSVRTIKESISKVATDEDKADEIIAYYLSNTELQKILKDKPPFAQIFNAFKSMQAGNWDVDNLLFRRSSSLEVPSNVRSKTTLPTIDFQVDTETGYASRTKINASADATIAIAQDFTTSGEKATKKYVEQQGKKYIPVDLTNPNNINNIWEIASFIVNRLNNVGAQSLNIAGNGIYTLKTTQDSLDDYVYRLLKQVVEHPNLKTKITSIRSGGQTGVDEAGVKAARLLGIPAKILAPNGWKFRDATGKDISDETLFKARFDQAAPSVLFGGNTNADLVKVTIDLNGLSGKEFVKARADAVRQIFEENTGTVGNFESQYHKFDMAYGPTLSIYEDTADYQISRLEQNDLVLLPQNLKFSKKTQSWQVEKGDPRFDGKESYRPIIDSFIDKETGKSFVIVPSADGTQQFTIEGDHVLAYRRYAGDLKRGPVDAATKAEATQILADAYEDINKDTSELKEIHKDGLDFAIVIPSNKNSVGFTFYNADGVIDIYNGINKKDIVKVDKLNGKGERIRFRGVVTGIFGNALEIVTAPSDGSLGSAVVVRLDDLVEIIYRREGHPELEELFTDFLEEKDNRINDSHHPIYFEYFLKDKSGNLTGKTEPIEKYSLNNKDSYQQAMINRRRILSTIKSGDLVNVKWIIDGKEVSAWRPVIGATTDKVYYFTKEGRVQYVSLKDNDTKGSRIIALAHNNVKDVELFKKFQDMRQEHADYFNIVSPRAGEILDAEEKNKVIREHLQMATAVTVQEEYYMQGIEQDEEMTEEKANALKVAISKIQRGDVLKAMMGDTEESTRFKWYIVTDIDERGRPLCVTYTKGGPVDTGTKKFNKKGGYRVYPVDPENIIMIGYNLTEDIENSVHGHPKFRDFLTRVKDKFAGKNTPEFYPNKADADKVAGRRRMIVEPAMYGKRNGISTWGVSEKYFDEGTVISNKDEKGKPMYYVKGIANNRYLSKEDTNYNNQWDLTEDDLYRLHDLVGEGDKITRTWEYQKDGVLTPYVRDYVIEKKNADSLKVIHVDKDGILHSSLILRNKDGSYSGITEVGFSVVNNPITGEKRNWDITKQLVEDLKQSVIYKKREKTSPTLVKKMEGVSRKKSPPKDDVFFSRTMLNYEKSSDSLDKIAAVVNQLKAVYNVDIELLRSSEIYERFENIVEGNPSKQRGFIYEGKIYINVDLSSSSEPLHEMGHLVLSALKNVNPDFYGEILSMVAGHPDYNKIASEYPGRTGEDLAGEVFLTIFGEHYRNTLKSREAEQWNKENTSVFARLLAFFKDILARTLNSDEIIHMDDKEFMNSSLDTFLNKFGDDLMKGEFSHTLLEHANAIPAKIETLKKKLLNGDKLEQEMSLTKICSL